MLRVKVCALTGWLQLAPEGFLHTATRRKVRLAQLHMRADCGIQHARVSDWISGQLSSTLARGTPHICLPVPPRTSYTGVQVPP